MEIRALLCSRRCVFEKKLFLRVKDCGFFAVKLKAKQLYTKKPKSYSATNKKLQTSGRVTLFQMGEARLKASPEITKIQMAMPNKHSLLNNLAAMARERNMRALKSAKN